LTDDKTEPIRHSDVTRRRSCAGDLGAEIFEIDRLQQIVIDDFFSLSLSLSCSQPEIAMMSRSGNRGAGARQRRNR